MPKPMWDELKFRKDQSFHRQTARLFNHDLLVDEFDLLVEKSRGLSIALLASRIIAWGSVFMIDLASVLAFGTSGPGPVSLPSRVHHRSSRYNSMSLCQRRVGVSTWGAIQLRLIRNLPLRICSAFTDVPFKSRAQCQASHTPLITCHLNYPFYGPLGIRYLLRILSPLVYAP